MEHRWRCLASTIASARRQGRDGRIVLFEGDGGLQLGLRLTWRPAQEAGWRSGWLAAAGPDEIRVSPAGLLRVDSLLHRFFLPEHTDVRYT